MAIIRRAALFVHLAGLTLGLFVAAAAINSALANISTDYVDVALSRVATAASLLTATESKSSRRPPVLSTI